METLIGSMMNLIASEVCGKKIDVSQYVFTDEELIKLYELSKSHDLANIVGQALIKNGLIKNDEIKAEFQKEVIFSIYRYEHLNYELTKLCEALEQAKISFIPLKGSVIRRYYPEPWMRTSCDIDILVHREELQTAVSYLTKQLGYRYDSQNSHDISMFTHGGVHIELHYDLVEDNLVNFAAVALKCAWNTAVRHNDSEFQYEMTDEIFYSYHIAHMAKHFIGTGGCGVRPFLDIWILNHYIAFDKQKREKLIEDCGLSVFAKQAELLSEIWFGNAEHTDVTKQMEEYILRGGVYGIRENRIAVQQQKKGGRLKYALSKIFIPYDVIKFHYPILQKHRFLTPIMEVRRWGKLIFCGHLKRTVKELEYNSNLSGDDAAEAQKLLKNVGL